MAAKGIAIWTDNLPDDAKTNATTQIKISAAMTSFNTIRVLSALNSDPNVFCKYKSVLSSESSFIVSLCFDNHNAFKTGCA